MRNRFTMGDVVYGDEIISGGVDYDIDVNGGTELTAGIAACGSLKFSVLADSNPFRVDDEFAWSRRQIEETEYTDIGQFKVTQVNRRGQRYFIEAVDGMAQFDVPVDAWLNGLTYPTTHEAMLSGLCAHLGVPLSERSALTCGDRPVPSSPAWEGATGREILAFLAEASGCFARMLPDGALYVGWYTDSGVALTKANYTGPYVAEYTVAAIDRLQIRANYSDIGVVVGDGENTYIIEGNPFLTGTTDEEIRPYAERLLAKLSALTYVPCEIPLYNDRGLRPGDIFTIDGAQSIVMTLRCTERGSTAASTGSERRPVQASVRNRDVMALIGKTNELERTVEKTASTLTEQVAQTEQAMRSLIDQTTQSILLEVSNSYATEGEMQEAISTQLKVLEDSVAIQFRTLQAVVDENGTDTQTLFAELYKYIKFEGGAIALGSSDSAITLAVENDMIVFRRSGVQFGWWDGVDFHTGNIVVEVSQRAQFGNFAFVPRGDGSLSFVKVGE